MKFFLLSLFILISPISYGEYAGDELTLGTMALRYKKSSSFWIYSDSIALDASTHTIPPDSKYFDRRVEHFFVLGVETKISDRLSFRTNIKSFTSYQKKVSATPPSSPVTTTASYLEPSIDMTYITPKGLELIFGFMIHNRPEGEEISQLGEITSTKTLREAYTENSRFGIVKRGSSWSGSFYYIGGDDSTRKVKVSVSDGNDYITSGKISKPTEFGLALEFKAGSNLIELDLASISASDFGELTSLGNSVYDDHLRLRVGSIFPLLGFNLGTTLSHKTLSYSDSSYANLDTIPISTLDLSIQSGNPSNNSFLGITYGLGRDKISIPQLNATYKLDSIGIILGLFSVF